MQFLLQRTNYHRPQTRWFAVSPIVITENLFFAIFGQKETGSLALSLAKQPYWTHSLFKVSFSLYMLTTVVVLLNLLIAMLSDTYQSITSQSDLQWKYGLSKLIRNMQKTSTAPSPLNLVSAWSLYLIDVWKKRKEKDPARHRGRKLLGDQINKWITSYQGNKNVIPWPRHSVDQRKSISGSEFSLDERVRIGNVVDWDVVRRKYRVLFGGEIERPSHDEEDELDE